MVAERFSMGHHSVRKMAGVLDDSEQFPNREYTRLAAKPQGKFAILEKKTLATTERREEERAQFREQMKELDVKRLIVVDECGSTITLTPRYGWAPKGQRLQGSVPRNWGKNVCSCPFKPGQLQDRKTGARAKTERARKRLRANGII